MENFLKNSVIYSILLTLLVVFLFPFYWMAVTSIMTNREIYGLDFHWFPNKITFEHYKTAWIDRGVSHYFANSLIIATATTIVSTTISALGSYAICRFRFRGRKVFDKFILFTYLVPVIVLIIPFYLGLSSLQLYNTRIGLILACTCYSLPFSLWLLKGFFQEIPLAIEEAAMIDGASHLQAFFKVTLPLSIPGLIATALFSFILAWNDYLFALVIIDAETLKTLPLAISIAAADYEASDGQLMAMGVIAVLPALIIYVFLQRYFVSGLSSGAVKG
jgi:multiple sugar transport system permease protein